MVTTTGALLLRIETKSSALDIFPRESSCFKGANFPRSRHNKKLADMDNVA